MVRIFNVTSGGEGLALAEFRSAVGNKPVVAAFYMDGCIHCSNLREPWTKFEEVVDTKYPDDDAVIAFVHKDVASRIMDKVGGEMHIQGYPTIMGFSNTGVPVEFEGARNAADLVAFYERVRGSKDTTGGRRARKGATGKSTTGKGKKGGGKGKRTRNGTTGKGTRKGKRTRNGKGKGNGKGNGKGRGKSKRTRGGNKGRR
jgi:vacuolar-type H+-ATPase subunit F/Vma7